MNTSKLFLANILRAIFIGAMLGSVNLAAMENRIFNVPTDFALLYQADGSYTFPVHFSETDEYVSYWDNKTNATYSKLQKNYTATVKINGRRGTAPFPRKVFEKLMARYNRQKKAVEHDFSAESTFSDDNNDGYNSEHLPADFKNVKENNLDPIYLPCYLEVPSHYVNPASIHFDHGLGFSPNEVHAGPDIRHAKGDCRNESQCSPTNFDDDGNNGHPLLPIDEYVEKRKGGLVNKVSPQFSGHFPPNWEWAELRTACEFGEVDKIRSIIETADNPYLIISQQDRIGDTALHLAIRRKQPEAIGLILRAAQRAGKLKDFLMIRNFAIAGFPARTPLELAQAELAKWRGDESIVELLETMSQED
jgi:hypothetical protein